MSAIISEEPILHFGRYKGRPISEIPRSYLYWLWDLPHLAEEIREEVWAELKRRGFQWGKYRGVPLDEVPKHYLVWTRENILFLDHIYTELIDAILAHRCVTETR